MVGKYSPNTLVTQYLTNEYIVPNFFACLYLNSLKISLNSHNLGANCFTPMVPPTNPKKQQCIHSNNYEYFAVSVPIDIIDQNTSNLNKHQEKCAGWFTAWEGKSPGSINPNLCAKLSAEEQGTLHKSLVEATVAIQLSFSVFETHRLRSVLTQLCHNFIWPKQQTIATIATKLYCKRKQELIKEIAQFPNGTYITVAIDFWTTKYQSQSYISMVGHTIVCTLGDLCSHIQGSGKQCGAFIHHCNKNCDPKVLPINLPMTRWNFLHQIQRAHQLKLSIHFYTNSNKGSKYYLNEEVWSPY
ncbi:hypothetical protein O181_020831 [Austropuccinia psidii MF-1]|uniref:Uncharacterized protein n=1 Tax=Austropuccinia psidii MF-1 TaxID=1389203 RepID=A0A9Q3CE92_9BASI|nr:hypothetical protein [Austropuccinia psidii MF-1]